MLYFFKSKIKWIYTLILNTNLKHVGLLVVKSPTFTRAVGSSKYGALFYSTERRKQLADIFFCLLFAEHPHEQLAICEETHTLVSVLRTGATLMTEER